MLFSVIPKKTLVFSAESAVSIAEALIAGTEYDLKAIYKKCEIRERVRLGPSTGSIVEAVSRSIPWIRLGTNSLVQWDME
jgi:cyanophycin synthetase